MAVKFESINKEQEYAKFTFNEADMDGEIELIADSHFVVVR